MDLGHDQQQWGSWQREGLLAVAVAFGISDM